jgi:hypothetical protein
LTIDCGEIINRYNPLLEEESREFVEQAAERIVAAKRRGGKVVVVTGSGPNLHEGVTTLIAHLMSKGLVDGVTTSAAVVAHEMAGTLDTVKRVDGSLLGFDAEVLPKGGVFEFSELGDLALEVLRGEMLLDEELLRLGQEQEGTVIIKAAGNMAYPMGLRTERLAREIQAIAQAHGLPFERVAGWGADPRTMLGAGARRNLPVLVTVPQLVGGGAVGLAIADSMTVTERCTHIAAMLASAEVIIESAVALTQEIHDGPFEVHTGHGIWAHWDGFPTYSLEGKSLIRLDLDTNLKKAWGFERDGQTVQGAIDKGLPKTKLTGIPFRMEMSGFARLTGSLPLIGDIGVLWPVLACKIALELGVSLEFISHPQGSADGQSMRRWIVESIRPIDRNALLTASRQSFSPDARLRLMEKL